MARPVRSVHGLILLFLLAGCKEVPEVPRVAHAGGGFAGETYTNSLQALDANKDRFDAFELDFVFTDDGELVCLHDWEGTAKKMFGRPFPTPPRLAEFEAMSAAHPRFTSCTVASLRTWLEANPDETVVTDVKDDNLRALTRLRDLIPDATHRVIPQIYHPDEFGPVRALGYERIIFTVYRMGGLGPRRVKRAARVHPYYAVTMPVWIAKDVVPSLRRAGIPTYVHTVNDTATWSTLQALGVSEIYTDWLAPGVDSAASSMQPGTRR